MPADPDRSPFYCPFPGCKRKFASLWRLKVHYRAPPNERGSGKERGHGVELPICPACGEELEPGKHHNKCKAGRTTNPPSKRVPKATTQASRHSKHRKTSHEPTRKKSAAVEEQDTAQDEPSSSSFPMAEMPLFAQHTSASMMAPVLHVDASGAMETQPYQGQYVVPPLFACAPNNSGTNTQPTAGFPAFDFGFFHGPQATGTPFQGGGTMLDMPHHSEMPASGRARSGDAACNQDSRDNRTAKSDAQDGAASSRQLPNKDPSLTAQAAAEVLYGIGRADGDGGDDSQPRLAFPHPAFMMPVPLTVGPNGVHMLSVQEGKPVQGEAVAADGASPSGPPPLPSAQQHDQMDMAGKLGQVNGTPVSSTAEGVPVEGFSAGVPLMVPWAPVAGMGSDQMFMMTPQGMMGVVGSSVSGCPILVPLSVLNGGKEGEGGADGAVPMHMLGNIAMPQFTEEGIKIELPGGMMPQMVAMNPDGTPHFVAAPHAGPSGEMVPVQGLQMVPFALRPPDSQQGEQQVHCHVAGVPDASQSVDVGGVTDEEWRNAVKSVQMRFQEATEVSATS